MEIARRYGVSTTPVREALATLQREGLVRLHPQRGAVVFLPDVDDLREHYEIRAALEALAAAKAAERFEPEWAAPLLAGLDEMRVGAAGGALHRAQPALPHGAVRAQRRPRLVEMIAALRDASSAYLHIYRAADDFPVERLDAEHREILAACLARDPERAARATREHLRGHRRARGGAAVSRILTTHVGSLPRPDDLIRTMFAKQEGVPVDPVALEAETRAAVAEIVRKQVAAGVDVV